MKLPNLKEIAIFFLIGACVCVVMLGVGISVSLKNYWNAALILSGMAVFFLGRELSSKAKK